ncbi:FAD-dependent oxidoreductase [Deinococcus irradiatisoli]|uniref:FAD-dependent oxidoreductase n=1 Tax=Deinococcus irradiatisoli TaxID=2202254 RepID=A0A2Z3JH63_9DEIO|nr:FAD-dependent oxidoreductase [Deinococcus irradiatisoli]AWN24342.1 FAD-dependent oxidoreductase [Deinococcus irradiatisoli]
MGQVYAHVGQKFGPRRYDVVVLGAGRMGALAAHFLMLARPQLNLLLLDRGGLPNEEGATILSPGLWTALDVPPERLEAAEFSRRLIVGDLVTEEGGLGPAGPHEAPTLRRGLIEWGPEEQAGGVPTPEVGEWPPGLLDPAQLFPARFDPQALTYSAAALTTRAAQSAVRAGADLMLNVEAWPTPTGVRLHRLSVTNTHEVVVHETHDVEAGQVVVAAGAEGPGLVEQALGAVTHHARAYRQLPRLNVPTGERTPVVRACGLTLRPQAGGFTVVPGIHHRDPHGYQPTGGRLSGVPVGVRRETLQDLLAAMEAVPALGTAALELGRSVGDVPGAWLALPEGGWPLHQPLTERHWLLLGGERADLVGPAAARALALGLTP